MATKEGDPILESLEPSPEEEEITLSDSELDDVLSSAEITAAEDNLEQYGVWVKAGPQDVAGDGEADFELADLEPDKGATLTEEEEKLLGELEEDSEIGEGLSVLEDDLEELGRGAPEPGPAVEIEDLGTRGPAPGGEALELEEMPEPFPDLEEETLEGLESLDAAAGAEAERDIEVALSDRATVEEHYEDLAPLESVPSTPGVSPPNILERIEKDLNQIKAEIQNLKNELAGFAGGTSRTTAPPPASAAAASFAKGDDDTIALTGDELDNILNTADVTEEPASGEGLEEVETLQSPEVLDLEEEPAPAEAQQSEGQEIDLEGLPELGDGPELGEGPELAPVDDILAPGTLEVAEEPLEELELTEAAEEPLSLEPAGGAPAGELLPEIGEIQLGEEPGAGPAEEISLEEPAGLEELETLEELEIPEVGAAAEQSGTVLPEAEEPALEELSLEEGPPAEADIEEIGLAEESPAELETAEGIPEIELAADELQPAESPAQPPAVGGVGTLSQELQSDIRSVLSYLDTLLEDLPKEKIQEFAQSQYFGIYKRLFEELGLGA